MNRIITFLWIVIVVIIFESVEGNDQSLNETLGIEEHSKILSRRKRFLIFPEGSSFQLVFEHQNHGYLEIGNVVWFSNTAALAWELPSDPQLFYMLKDKTKVFENRRQDNKHIYYLDEDGKVLNKVSYHKKFIVNPAMGKRSVKGNTPKENDVHEELSIKDMHDKEKRKNHYQDMDHKRIEFHRSNRQELYEKIEKVLEGLGYNGQQCVLRLLCEAGQKNDKQGSFIEEIIKATFTLPRGRGVDSRRKYDVAHGTRDCVSEYPDCSIYNVN